MTPPATDSPRLPGDDAWLEVVRQLHAALSASSFRSVARVPTTRNRFALAFELRNLRGFVTGDERRLMEATAMPGLYRRLQRWRDRHVAQLLGFFVLGEPMAENHLDAMLAAMPGAPDVRSMVDAGVATDDAGQLRCRVRVLPSGELLQWADVFDRSIADFAYIGRDSLYFADRLRGDLAGRRVARALDLCCGTGIQGLTVAAHADRVDGVDLNPRAVAYANLNADLAGLGGVARFRVGDLAADMEGPYDLVVVNPPYVLMPPDEAAHNRDGHGGGRLGLDIAARILADLDRLLGPRGEALMVCNSPVVGGRSSLPDLMSEILAGTGLGATLTELNYIVDRKRAPFHRSLGISHTVYNYARIARDLPAGVRVVPMPLHLRAMYAGYVKVASRVYGAG